MASEPAGYTAEHVRDQLLHDERVGELDVHLEIEGDVVFVRGHVSTPDRRAALDDVLAELLPGYKVCNETTVAVFPEAPE
jgi:osmotically-inducible protein OsmY